jgi:hypothetical protein
MCVFALFFRSTRMDNKLAVRLRARCTQAAYCSAVRLRDDSDVHAGLRYYVCDCA